MRSDKGLAFAGKSEWPGLEDLHVDADGPKKGSPICGFACRLNARVSSASVMDSRVGAFWQA